MTATIPATSSHTAPRHTSLELGPLTRAAVGLVGAGLTAACALAIIRYAAGLSPDHPGAHLVAVAIHVAAVLPAVPLGAWLMLSRKGTPRHKFLGKIWVLLMVVTALSALFIRQANDGQFSPIHLFVPLTLHGAWQAVATIRRGDIAGHRKALMGLYLGALALPGLFSFLPDRLMGTWLLG
ncbi:DUF2306 domain-containing protein [Novosphingobium aquae]|uniref:DUF2306 domain-containing protein n=1 Tax=Novosphingobium aquae TaxID=3133435 RepID=A0ABU8SCU6_9SPHN